MDPVLYEKTYALYNGLRNCEGLSEGSTFTGDAAIILRRFLPRDVRHTSEAGHVDCAELAT